MGHKIIQFLIRVHTEKIGEIFVTLDSHHKKHIAHAAFWNNQADGNGTERPDPFSCIRHSEVGSKWYPRDPSLLVSYNDILFACIFSIELSIGSLQGIHQKFRGQKTFCFDNMARALLGKFYLIGFCCLSNRPLRFVDWNCWSCYTWTYSDFNSEMERSPF